MVDGFLIEADLPQVAPKSEAHARLVRGPRRSRCGFVVYANGGSVTRKCHGYKWMQLSLLKLGGVALHGKLFPANVNERAALCELLAEAFELWPELNQQKHIYLLGDALYDMEEQLAYDLVFQWGVHPVFPRGGSLRGDLDHVRTAGVPVCECGELAMLDEADKFPTPLYRLKHGLAAPGEYLFNSRGNVIDNARIRWRCPKKRPQDRCRWSTDTYPRQNARLYTYLPHAGSHNRAAMRTALYAYRNVIESSFSVLKDMGLAGKSQDRPKWAGDDEMDHLVWMAVTTMSARRVVHATGLYEQVHAEAAATGLLTAPSVFNKRPGPSDLDPTDAAQWARSLVEYAKAPGGWPEVSADSDEFHGLADLLALDTSTPKAADEPLAA